MFFSSRNTGSSLGRIKQHVTWKYRYWRLNSRFHRERKKGNRIKLIVGVREPVSRAVSGYFQSLMERESGRDINTYVDGFFAYCPHMLPLKWFDIELKNRLGIDVYKYAFDKDRGFTVFSSGLFDVFVYQVELLESLTRELGEFVGCPNLELVTVNEASEKWSGELYRKFKDEVAMPFSYLELMYCSEYFNHFYGEKRKSDHMAKWMEK